LNKTVPKIIEDVLKDGGLTSLDFEFKLEKEYPKWEYICQYRESHLNFVSRWMEREGMYYYFEQAESGEKVIITDTKMAHTEMPEGKTMYYSPPSGLTEFHREEVIHAFICRQKMLPKTLRLKDYNYRTPSLEISGSAKVSADGRGDVYIYGEHFKTPDEGNQLAKIRAEELLCQEKQFHGESTIPYLRPGYLFDIEDHYRGSFNQNYLTIELEHEGSQTAFLLAGIQKGLSEVEEQPYYRNSFVVIPSGVQYRHERKTEKPRFYGTLNAKIDAAGSGKYAVYCLLTKAVVKTARLQPSCAWPSHTQEQTTVCIFPSTKALRSCWHLSMAIRTGPLLMRPCQTRKPLIRLHPVTRP
jgi:type VI secretion system secreted protein VgrG